MEMQFKNEIKKLADIVVWADNWITELKDGLTEEEFEEDAEVKEFEAVKKAVLESMERHAVYTNALNKDIADKAAKIDLLEKEIDGRKAGYVALKTQMDHSRESASYWHDEYVKLQEENDELKKDSKTHYDMYKYGEELLKVKNSEIEKLKKELNESYKAWDTDSKNHSKRDMTLVDEIAKKNDEIEKLKKELDAREEEVKKLNKCIMEKNESINTGNETIINLRKEIGAHEDEAKRLENRIKDWKATATNNGLKIEKLKVDLVHEREKNEKLAKDHAELENDMRRVSKERDGYAAKLNDLRWFDVIDITLDCKKAIEESKKGEDDHGRAGFKEYIKWLVKEEEEKFKESWKARLNEELEAIFKAEEEETEVDDIPCGSDSIE